VGFTPPLRGNPAQNPATLKADFANEKTGTKQADRKKSAAPPPPLRRDSRRPSATNIEGDTSRRVEGENDKSSSSSMDLSFAHFSLDAKRLFDLLSPSERSEFRDDVCEFACAAHRMGEGAKLVGEWIKNAKRQAKAGQMFDYLKGCVRHSANDRGLRWTDLTKDCPPSPSDWPGVATVSLKIDRERLRIGIYKSNPAKWSQASDAEMEEEINRRIEAAS
jgi:hypothetical protein